MPRNPDWVTDELILVLDLYLAHGQLDDTDPKVIEASEILNRLPIHTSRPDIEKFRNPNGVALKMANFRAIDPNDPAKGMPRGNRLDREVFEHFDSRREELHRLADMLRAGSTDVAAIPSEPMDDEEAVEEGRLVFRTHRARERDPRLARKKKQEAVRLRGKLDCLACGFDFEQTYGDTGTGFMEVHHVLPLSQTGQTQTRLRDLALLCSNCHRMAHRRHPWPTLEDLVALVQIKK